MKGALVVDYIRCTWRVRCRPRGQARLLFMEQVQRAKSYYARANKVVLKPAA